jgi:hypothetical protein
MLSKGTLWVCILANNVNRKGEQHSARSARLMVRLEYWIEDCFGISVEVIILKFYDLKQLSSFEERNLWF